jgi:hypothetical protein
VSLIVMLVILVVALGYGGWSIYHDRQTAAASSAFNEAMKAYSGRVGPAAPGEPVDPSEMSYPDETGEIDGCGGEVYQGGGQIPEHESWALGAVTTQPYAWRIWTSRIRRWRN